MVQLVRTDGGSPDFLKLVKRLDADLFTVDGEDQLFYGQFNKVDAIRQVVVAYSAGQAIACGALKDYNGNRAEIKRMYTEPLYRRNGIAGQVLAELEKWAGELSYQSCLLETGKRQPAAIALYTKQGYRIIPNYGQYAKDENSVCFEKRIQR